MYTSPILVIMLVAATPVLSAGDVTYHRFGHDTYGSDGSRIHEFAGDRHITDKAGTKRFATTSLAIRRAGTNKVEGAMEPNFYKDLHRVGFFICVVLDLFLFAAIASDFFSSSWSVIFTYAIVIFCVGKVAVFLGRRGWAGNVA